MRNTNNKPTTSNASNTVRNPVNPSKEVKTADKKPDTKTVRSNIVLIVRSYSESRRK